MTNIIKTYLLENETIHEFRVKFAVEPTDEQLDAMETHLQKYEAFDIGTPKKTIMQQNPRDFRSIKAAEIFMIDFKTKQPAAPLQLLAELSQKTGIHERLIVLRNKAEPLHIEDDQDEDDEEYTTRLTDADYSEAEKIEINDYFGQDHLENFLKELEKKRKEHLEEVETDNE